MYKKSKYNYVVEKDSEVYIYNFLYRTFLKVSKECWEKPEKDKKVIELLRRYGILLNEDINEYELFRVIVNEKIFSKKSLMIFLSMTPQCNFSCPYCYQDCRKESESETFIENEKVDTVYKYIKEYIESNNVENLGVVFFGGEPTINESKLMYAIEKFSSFNVKKNFALITNGYELTRKLIKKISEIDGFSVQITLDGYGKNHDEKRYLKGGGATFDKIYNNIKIMSQRYSMKTLVRVNVDLNEISNYFSMIDELKKDGAENFISRIAFEAIFDGQKKHNCNHTKADDDLIKLYNYARAAGFRVDCDIISGPCMMHSISSMAIDENLNVYNCPGKLYSQTVGYINDKGQFCVNSNEWYHEMLTVRECAKTCLYAPICYGGCAMNQSCNKRHIETFLQMYIDDKINNYQSRI